MALRRKQQRFAEEYPIDLNATQAALRAGYSPKTAYSQGQRLLKNVEVQNAIQAAMAQRSKRVQITQDGVLQEIALLQYSDVSHYTIDDRGNLTLAADAPPGAMRAVSSLRKRVRHHDDGSITYDTEFRLWNKPASLRMGGQHLALFTEKVEVSGEVGVVHLPSKAPTPETWVEETQHLQPGLNGHQH